MMPIVIWAGQGRDRPLIYFQKKQKYKKTQWQRLFKAQEVTASGTEGTYGMGMDLKGDMKGAFKKALKSIPIK